MSSNLKGGKERRGGKKRSSDSDDSHGAEEISNSAKSCFKKRRQNREHVLKGLVIAISTVQNTTTDSTRTSSHKTVSLEEQHGSYYSYRQVSELCQSAGAKVSGQVHKRVHCLLCSPAAIAQQSQRVRKAIKNLVPLVHVHWLDQCLERNLRLPFDEFLLESTTSTCAGVVDGAVARPKAKTKGFIKETKTSENDTSSASFHIDTNHEALADACWSDLVDVRCCCGCRETHTTVHCEYCTDCQNNNNNTSSYQGRQQLPDNGWSSPIDVGCCCLCHEMDTTADCQWCKDDCTVKKESYEKEYIRNKDP
jgi:BRCA1 C Terminus (BRCT) domain